MIHLCNNFVSSKVHALLILAMSSSVPKQDVIVPVRHSNLVGVNDVSNDKVSVRYLVFANDAIKYFPFIKTIYIAALALFSFKRVIKSRRNVDNSSRVMCIGHNFWSDGVPLFLFSFFFPIRYGLVVRNTDINIFIPRLVHCRWLMGWMIKRSSGLIFVSEAHARRFRERWPALYGRASKTSVIANGVEDFWHDNRIVRANERAPVISFVGRFDRNKNIGNLVDAAEIVYRNEPRLKLLLVGGSADEFMLCTGRSSIPEFVQLPGVVKDKAALSAIYRRSRVFAMPSHAETFGLVFIEALSQGCALVCTRGEGIDGAFSSSMVQAVDPNSPEEIAAALSLLLANNVTGVDCRLLIDFIKPFAWKHVADSYIEFFE